jgi:predicted GIY-YIG superfamily endonuclease
MRRILAPQGLVRHAAAVPWCVYLLRCGDGTLYAGITNDLPKRLGAHLRGRGARYTRGRGPLTVVHQEPARTRSAALRRELELKRMRRREKLAFLDSLRGRG